MTRTSPAPAPHQALIIAEVDMAFAQSETRAVVAFTQVPRADGDWTAAPVAALTWDATSAAVEIVYVHEAHRRQRLAIVLWQAASTIEPDLGHSRDRSPTGTSWAMSVGGVLPPIEVDRDDTDTERRGALLLDTLGGFGPDHVLRVLREPASAPS